MAKIAVIDDSRSTIDLITSILRQAHHDVVSFQEVEGIETRLADARPDAILLDIVMPARSGYEIMRSLRRKDPTKNIPIIVVSSKGEESDRAWATRQGAVGYVTKPFTSDALLSELGSVLDR